MFVTHTFEKSDITWEPVIDCKQKQKWLTNFHSPRWLRPQKENQLKSQF